ncbi:glycosyltransferase [Prosthecochloris sp. N3]|uniref:Glycosyltransferase n=1 Tax=Prosthecochloris ethylica TaxID=2743976 RepID=A0ABR9XRT7_9CHLB|nr:glycosyltransferase [Prosthecochloris ethylica]MBF0586890.1 glycosyltransferase [Prosthecochloris ethylica]MBF0636762.1 glycosyltransferase [Prosthecochloris ethylica]NUK47978.1 glycosyltransferase [Prosthecochloris ethylica]
MTDTAVVIPLYRQPQYVCEAAASALSDERSHVVVVSDGWMDDATRRSLLFLSRAEPSRMTVIHHPNRGLSGARNAGIVMAQQILGEQLKYVFPLDADNWLGEGALSRMRAALDADAAAAWAAPDMSMFGARRDIWHVPEFSTVRQVYQNQCDAGSLYRADIFRKGYWFDERMREGYEDWEFFLRLALAGYRGTRAGTVGFNYRVKAESMLTETVKKHHAIIAQAHGYNQLSKRHDDLISAEHRERPRFLMVNNTTLEFRYVTDLSSLPTGQQEKAYRSRLASLYVIHADGVPELLSKLRLLPGTFYRIQQELETNNCIGLKLTVDAERASEIVLSPYFPTQIGPRYWSAIFAKTPDRAPKSVDDITPSAGLELRIGIDHLHPSEVIQLYDGVLTFPEPPSNALRSFETSQSDRLFGDLSAYIRRLPKARGEAEGLRLAIVAPWIGLGGVDACVLELSSALKVLGCTIDLVLTEKHRVETSPHRLACFDSIHFVKRYEGDDDRTGRDFLGTVGHVDAVINAHSGLCFEVYQRLGKAVLPPQFAYLHVLDKDQNGRAAGWPIRAAECSQTITGYLAISQQLIDQLQAMDVPPERIALIRNAPVVPHVKPTERRALPDDKPLQVLYAGRFDRQKGVERLARVVELSRRSSVTFRFIGDSVLAEIGARNPLEGIDALIEPSVHERDLLATAFRAADVVLLPSRWEGVPLVMLDAMASGCVFVGTDVGAVSEVIRTRENGLLVPDGDDETTAQLLAHHLSWLDQNRSEMERIRRTALCDAQKMSWINSARMLIEVIKDATFN